MIIFENYSHVRYLDIILSWLKQIPFFERSAKFPRPLAWMLTAAKNWNHTIKPIRLLVR